MDEKNLDLIKDYKYSPNTELESGIESFTNWYLNYKKWYTSFFRTKINE